MGDFNLENVANGILSGVIAPAAYPIAPVTEQVVQNLTPLFPDALDGTSSYAKSADRPILGLGKDEQTVLQAGLWSVITGLFPWARRPKQFQPKSQPQPSQDSPTVVVGSTQKKGTIAITDKIPPEEEDFTKRILPHPNGVEINVMGLKEKVSLEFGRNDALTTDFEARRQDKGAIQLDFAGSQDRAISERHGKMTLVPTYDGTRVIIADHSRNGTVVNGRRCYMDTTVVEVDFGETAIITIGRTTIKIGRAAHESPAANVQQVLPKSAKLVLSPPAAPARPPNSFANQGELQAAVMNTLAGRQDLYSTTAFHGDSLVVTVKASVLDGRMVIQLPRDVEKKTAEEVIEETVKQAGGVFENEIDLVIEGHAEGAFETRLAELGLGRRFSQHVKDFGFVYLGRTDAGLRRGTLGFQNTVDEGVFNVLGQKDFDKGDIPVRLILPIRGKGVQSWNKVIKDALVRAAASLETTPMVRSSTLDRYKRVFEVGSSEVPVKQDAVKKGRYSYSPPNIERAMRECEQLASDLSRAYAMNNGVEVEIMFRKIARSLGMAGPDNLARLAALDNVETLNQFKQNMGEVQGAVRKVIVERMNRIVEGEFDGERRKNDIKRPRGK